MTPLTPHEERTAVLIMLDMFGWENDEHTRYHALRILKQARGEPVPTFDDFKLTDRGD